MKIAAIIAEYNPFHNGHRYLIEEVRRQGGADFVLAVMSGDFVQRGAPAFTDKFIRTEMALLGGVDVVIELPSLYAVSSAEFFAGGAVTLLNRLNVIDLLAFGSESGDLSLLEGCAHLLAEREEDLAARLKTLLRAGLSYPAARMRAFSELLSVPDAESLFSSPNNILGLEYCKALVSSRSLIRPLTIKRKGEGYHSTSYNFSVAPDSQYSACNCHTFSTPAAGYASATAIRRALSERPEAAADCIPPEVWRLLAEKNLLTSPVTEDDFSLLLHYKLLAEKEQGFSGYLDCTPDLSDKIVKKIPCFTRFKDFCHLLKSKDLTYTRISRVLTHILLDIKTPDFFLPPLKERNLYTPYARLLGFRESAMPVLSALKKNSTIPLISKMADARFLLDENAFGLLKQDIHCASVYGLALADRIKRLPGQTLSNEQTPYRTVPDEFRQSPVILP